MVNKKRINNYSLSYIYIFLMVFVVFGCSKDNEEPVIVSPTKPEVPAPFVLNTSPNWKVEDDFFFKGEIGTFDDVAVKDPSIVFSDGKWHLFYTGRDANYWRTGYASATTLLGLKTANRTYLGSLDGGTYFCAPQVFYHSIQKKWYLIYQSGKAATFSTNSDISNSGGWTNGSAMGFTDGIDFWCIADATRIYCFYSAQDGSHNIKSRNTLISEFPYNWSSPVVTATETFEAPHVYKNKTDGKYYMMVEDIGRYFELWISSSLGGTWTKINEKWASKVTLTDTKTHWTDQVSHGEIIRTGVNENCEIDDINKCQILIQGALNGNYPNYGDIPYKLGIIKNY